MNRTKPPKIPAWKGARSPDAPSLVEELQAFGSHWRRETLCGVFWQATYTPHPWNQQVKNNDKNIFKIGYKVVRYFGEGFQEGTRQAS